MTAQTKRTVGFVAWGIAGASTLVAVGFMLAAHLARPDITRR